ncbi:hypothetical protein NLX71_25940 [Paenibacillus sp. MZ04-78.2]|uniref:hypothetical protein n=1 Tax=Paenibacillus sp. MZ04-78.2 TaxID=2962034 RepID=UPI0020B8EF23|nr:hypothetical protein [Paenibacillus sp. MZ04-78.2]MCP3776684.1 hypothetical protein [Paenibacillus sp. MZ04-78.2]
MLAQWDAIALGESEGGNERITVKRLKKVASEHLQLVQPMIKALKTHNKSAIYDIDDLYPKWNDFSAYLSKSEEKVSVHGKLREQTMHEANVDHDRTKILEMVKLAVSLGSTAEKAEEIALHIIKNNEPHVDITSLRMEVARLIMKGFSEPDPNDVRNYIPNNGKASPEALYKALSQAGYTGSNDVLFPEGSVS